MARTIFVIYFARTKVYSQGFPREYPIKRRGDLQLSKLHRGL